jgi:hypothetical protein
MENQNQADTAPVDRLVMPWDRDVNTLTKFCEQAAIVHLLDTGTHTAATLKQALWWIQFLDQFRKTVENVHQAVSQLSPEQQDVITAACRNTAGICFCGNHGSSDSGVDFGDGGESVSSA